MNKIMEPWLNGRLYFKVYVNIQHPNNHSLWFSNKQSLGEVFLVVIYHSAFLIIYKVTGTVLDPELQRGTKYCPLNLQYSKSRQEREWSQAFPRAMGAALGSQICLGREDGAGSWKAQQLSSPRRRANLEIEENTNSNDSSQRAPSAELFMDAVA